MGRLPDCRQSGNYPETAALGRDSSFFWQRLGGDRLGLMFNNPLKTIASNSLKLGSEFCGILVFDIHLFVDTVRECDLKGLPGTPTTGNNNCCHDENSRV